MDIFTRMNIDYVPMGKTQPGDIILIENNLWVVVNRTREETCRLCKSLHVDDEGGYENRIIQNTETCGLIAGIDVFNPEEAKNKIVNSVDNLVDSFLKGLF